MQPLIAMLVPAVAVEGMGAAMTGLSGQNGAGQNPTGQIAVSGFDALVAALTAAGNGVTLAADGTPVPAIAEQDSAKPTARPDQTAEGASLAALMLQMAGLRSVKESLPLAEGDGTVSPVVAGEAPVAPSTATAAAEPELTDIADPSALLEPAAADLVAAAPAVPDEVAQPLPAPPAAIAASATETTLTTAAAGAAASTTPNGLPSAIDMLRSARSKGGDTARSAISTGVAATADTVEPSTGKLVAAVATDTDVAEGLLSDNAGGDAAVPVDGMTATPDPSALSAPVETSPEPASALASPAGQTSVAAVREVAASQHLHSTRMTGTPHLSPAAQLTGRIEQAVSEGQTTLTVRLDPESLGRVEVKLELQDGRVTASIAAERPATLDLLQRDARLLERAVQQSGLQLSDAGLQFSLREGAGQWAEAQSGQRRSGNAYGAAAVEPAADPLSPVAVYQSDSLVDIQI
jgi:flagellar hook-length control protein FliK